MWTRLSGRSNNEQMLMDNTEDFGPKRKAERLSMLFATHLGSVEVTGQPRQVQ